MGNQIAHQNPERESSANEDSEEEKQRCLSQRGARNFDIILEVLLGVCVVVLIIAVVVLARKGPKFTRKTIFPKDHGYTFPKPTRKYADITISSANVILEIPTFKMEGGLSSYFRDHEAGTVLPKLIEAQKQNNSAAI